MTNHKTILKSFHSCNINMCSYWKIGARFEQQQQKNTCLLELNNCFTISISLFYFILFLQSTLIVHCALHLFRLFFCIQCSHQNQLTKRKNEKYLLYCSDRISHFIYFFFSLMYIAFIIHSFNINKTEINSTIFF